MMCKLIKFLSSHSQRSGVAQGGETMAVSVVVGLWTWENHKVFVVIDEEDSMLPSMLVLKWICLFLVTNLANLFCAAHWFSFIQRERAKSWRILRRVKSCLYIGDTVCVARADVQINLSAVKACVHVIWKHMESENIKSRGWVRLRLNQHFLTPFFILFVYVSWKIKNFTSKQSKIPSTFRFFHFVSGWLFSEEWEAYNHNNLWPIKPEEYGIRLTSRLYHRRVHCLTLWIWCENFATFLMFCSSLMLCWMFRRW